MQRRRPETQAFRRWYQDSSTLHARSSETGEHTVRSRHALILSLSTTRAQIFLQTAEIASPKTVVQDERNIIQILQDGDEQATFRFLDLPPELRVQVYNFYFRSFEHLTEPVQPPISKVCRLLRQEALPVFYKACIFVFDLKHEVEERRALVHQSVPGRSGPHFFQAIPEEHLAMIRQILFDTSNAAYFRFDVRLRWEGDTIVRIADRKGEVTHPAEPYWLYAEMLDAIAQHGVKSLTRAHVRAVTDAVVRYLQIR